MHIIHKIPLEGVYNTRDLGGFPTEDGRRIKRRKLIRSGELFLLTEKDKKTLLTEYELKTILDFRTSTEAGERPDPELSEVCYIHHPILEEDTLGITREQDNDEAKNKTVLDAVLSAMSQSENGARTYMADLYHSLITDNHSKTMYRNFFRILSEHGDGSLLWHCTAGKDRAGTACILLLHALQVPREVILKDYFMVNEFTKQQIDEKVAMVYEKTGSEEICLQIRSLFSADPAYIDSIYTTTQREYGSMSAYLEQEMELTPDRLRHLRNLYLE